MTLWEAEIERVQAVRESEDPMATPNTFLTLFKAHKKYILLGGLGRLIADGCGFASPFMLRELINWLSDCAVDPTSRKEHEGYIWSAAIAVTQIVMSYANNACLFYTSKGFAQMKASAAIALFDKAGHLESDNGLDGIAVQLHTTDSTKFLEMSFFFHQMFTAPLLIVGALIGLYDFIGWGGVICVVAIVVFFPFMGLATAKISNYRRDVADWADKRLSAMGELLEDGRSRWSTRFA